MQHAKTNSPRNSQTITLEESLALTQLVDISTERYSAELWKAIRREEMAEMLAEQVAENGWLKYAESLGWEEAHMEEMIEVGFRSRLY